MTPRQHRVEGLESLRPRHRKRIASRSDYQRKRGKHRCGCKMSTGWNERERQDQFLIMYETASTGHYLARGTSLCPFSRSQFLCP